MLAAATTPGTKPTNIFAIENFTSIAACGRRLHLPLAPIAVRSHCASSTEMRLKGKNQRNSRLNILQHMFYLFCRKDDAPFVVEIDNESAVAVGGVQSDSQNEQNVETSNEKIEGDTHNESFVVESEFDPLDTNNAESAIAAVNQDESTATQTACVQAAC